MAAILETAPEILGLWKIYGTSPTTDAVPRRSYEMYVEDASITITP